MIMKQSVNLLQLDWVEHGFYNASESTMIPNPVLMQQVHSADVRYLQKEPDIMPQLDAFVTDCCGINLTVKTADCAPVLLADPVTRQVAAVHAGWRGAFQGILENTILTMVTRGAKAANILAAVGPHLQKDSFIVDQAMQSLFPITENRFFSIGKDGLIRFDFDAYICYRLYRAGIQSVESVGGDTYADQTYYSYRREPENPGRQFSCIMIKGEEHVK